MNWDYTLPTDEMLEIELTDEVVWMRLRKRRDDMLKESDWTQTIDSPVDKNIWAEYRKILRDIPASTNDPRIVDWPEVPS